MKMALLMDAQMQKNLRGLSQKKVKKNSFYTFLPNAFHFLALVTISWIKGFFATKPAKLSQLSMFVYEKTNKMLSEPVNFGAVFVVLSPCCDNNLA